LQRRAVVAARTKDLPKSVADLVDDPFRSLAGELRRAGGFANRRCVARAHQPTRSHDSVVTFRSPRRAPPRAQTFVQIGSPPSPKPSTVTNGDFQQGAGSVSLSCKVDPSGAGFNIQLSAQIGEPNGGSLIVVGQVNAIGGSGIQGTFLSAQNGTFVDQNCSFTFTYNMGPVPVGGSPVAAGRIWGHIDCPNAVESGTAEITADGAATERTCDAHADFLFENCQ
jgi:hypothetical protein